MTQSCVKNIFFYLKEKNYCILLSILKDKKQRSEETTEFNIYLSQAFVLIL